VNQLRLYTSIDFCYRGQCRISEYMGKFVARNRAKVSWKRYKTETSRKHFTLLGAIINRLTGISKPNLENGVCLMQKHGRAIVKKILMCKLFAFFTLEKLSRSN